MYRTSGLSTVVSRRCSWTQADVVSKRELSWHLAGNKEKINSTNCTAQLPTHNHFYIHSRSRSMFHVHSLCCTTLRTYLTKIISVIVLWQVI